MTLWDGVGHCLPIWYVCTYTGPHTPSTEGCVERALLEKQKVRILLLWLPPTCILWRVGHLTSLGPRLERYRPHKFWIFPGLHINCSKLWPSLERIARAVACLAKQLQGLRTKAVGTGNFKWVKRLGQGGRICSLGPECPTLPILRSRAKTSESSCISPTSASSQFLQERGCKPSITPYMIPSF